MLCRQLTVKSLNEYMNDPAIINEPMPNRELYAIRLMIYDETKAMSPEEMLSYYRKIEKDMHSKYRFRYAT